MPTSTSSAKAPAWKRVMQAEVEALTREAQRIDDLWAEILEGVWRGDVTRILPR